MSTKRTPGDWYTKREGSSTVYVFSRIGGGLVQEVAACGPTNDGPEQQEANARLISAAPELLEALAELAGLVDDICAGNYTPDSFTAQPARIALAKATGAQS